jgi:single-strand DNA-binding protein
MARILVDGVGRRLGRPTPSTKPRRTMSDTITITGLIATTPRHVVTSEGLPITSFRLASSQRRFDKATSAWVDASTNWYTVTAFRQLAINAVPSLSKGDRIVVTGRLRVRDWQTDDRTGTNVEIEAETLGHDLFWGTAVFTRLVALGGDSATIADDESAKAEPAETAVPV